MTKVDRDTASIPHRTTQIGVMLRADVVRAAVFDMDGVLVDTERDWDAARRRVARDSGGRWHPNATTDMIGMSAPEWSRYMHDELGVQAEPDDINRRVVAHMLKRIASGLPLLPGAAAAVESLAARWPLARGAVASGSRPPQPTGPSHWAPPATDPLGT